VKAFEDSGGLVGLETLEYANNEPLRQQADAILDTYFYKDEENGTVSCTTSLCCCRLCVCIVCCLCRLFVDIFITCCLHGAGIMIAAEDNEWDQWP